MDDYNAATITSAYQNLKVEQDNTKETNDDITKAFIKFIKEYRNGNVFKYREQLQYNMQKGIHKLEIDFEDLDAENKNLSDVLIHKPGVVIPLFETAIKEVVGELDPNKLENSSIDEIPDYQFILNTNANPKNIREINSSTIHELVVISGIVISASKSYIKMKKVALQCRNCGNMKYIQVKSGFTTFKIPRQCDNSKLIGEQREKCPLDSYTTIAEKSQYIDVQTLKIQEAPELIPIGEIPRSYMLYCDRTLVNQVSPGTRVTVVGIQCVDERENDKGINDRSSYIKVIQFMHENKKTGRQKFIFTEEDQRKFNLFAKTDKIYEKISRSIAPGIFGSEDIKKAIACLLFGGCRKRLNGGVMLRGDINILLLGDPSTAKSQFLKFVERVAPIAVYTSGKGSSAAGLTASIIRDPSSGEFQLEGGAMVLADGGIVCIDEFDKMRAQDRVAIHEAMEQQTISVAKAGITTTLNSRTSVLAAANPIYGHIDDLKTTQEQIDFQSTILSRFDCIFLVRDIHNKDRDEQIARHIVDISASNKVQNIKKEEGEISVNDLKKYIAWARMNCTPKLTEESAKALQNYYIEDRKKYNENKTKKGNDIPVTVRQLEAIIRLSEAIAKMSLSNVVTRKDVDEAHRLFQISTMSAASSRTNNVYEISGEEMKEVIKIEDAIKRRLAIGQRIQYSKLVEELVTRFTTKRLVDCAIINLTKTFVLKFFDEKNYS